MDWTSPSGEARILHGTCQSRLRDLQENSIHCCVTSPPYWGLRDYGHEDQIGLESTPEAYVERMVEVFREVRRVLRDDGTLWLNLGDSYAANKQERTRAQSGDTNRPCTEATKLPSCAIPDGLKPKDLVGIPWRVAFALQADGWWLRQDIIWHKPNPMPESVTDRCTKAHEYIFLLTKSARYYYDSEAVKEGSGKSAGVTTLVSSEGKKGTLRNDDGRIHVSDGTRNRRSVWTVSTKPYSGAHFATYPPDLIEPCILAGTSADGCCAECGSPWERIVEATPVPRRDNVIGYDYGQPRESTWNNGRRPNGADVAAHKAANPDRTIGWQPTCRCNAGKKPCTVLDPFNGSGTTGEVCIQHGRHYVGCEINSEYIELAKQRLRAAERRFGTPLFG